MGDTYKFHSIQFQVATFNQVLKLFQYDSEYFWLPWLFATYKCINSYLNIILWLYIIA